MAVVALVVVLIGLATLPSGRRPVSWDSNDQQADESDKADDAPSNSTSRGKDSSSSSKSSKSDATKSSQAGDKALDRGRLVGRWQRTDGEYVLEIREATEDGKLDAKYLNPKPINVSRAEWEVADGRLRVFVELRDANYPGSTYTVEFDSDEDKLTGNYFQAVQRENFPVEFTRQP